MLSKVLVAFTLTAIAGATPPAIPEEPGLSRSEIDEALGSDETCGTTSEEAAMCALKALQTKVARLAADGREQGQGRCDTGLVGEIKKMAPSCLEACPGICCPLGRAINAYMMRGGSRAAKNA